MSHCDISMSDKLCNFIALSQDAYAIFDSQDTLIYQNQAFADLMNLHPKNDLNIHWDEMLRANFRLKRGIRVSSGNIEQFIDMTHQARRSRLYRLFEVDFVDGRWFLFSEQMNESGELLMHVKEITKQKVIEETLSQKVHDLRLVATTDELTQVGNRRALVQSINNELERCRRSGASMSLLLFDLDFFKRVNDTFGHQAGDEVLKHVAAVLKSDLRPYDILGRIGGEEFAVFLSNTTAKEATRIGERMRKAIEESVIQHDGNHIPVTVSGGLTTLGCNAKFEDLYQQADEALYASKLNGRNKITEFASAAAPI